MAIRAYEPESEGGKIKPAGFRQEFTPQEMAEILICETDPIYFIEKYVRIEHPDLGPINFNLHGYQENLINVYHNHDRVVAMMPRQTGKTTTAAAYLLWRACFRDNQNLLVVSYQLEGALEIMERFWFAYEELPWWLKPGVKIDNIKSKVFDNGSKIKAAATTKKSGRGKSISLVYVDEFAFVDPGKASDFWAALFPTLSAGGDCIITSTPNTDEDKFAQIWFSCRMHKTSDQWVDAYSEKMLSLGDGVEKEKYEVLFEDQQAQEKFKRATLKLPIVTDVERATEGFVGFFSHWTKTPDYKRGGMRGDDFRMDVLVSGVSEEEWEREFECAFISGDETLISSQKLAVLRHIVCKPRYVDRWGCRWYEEIKPNTAYAVAMDPSDGAGLDDAVIQVWELPALKQVAEWNDNTVDQTEQTRMLRRVLLRIYMLQQDFAEHRGGMDIYYSVERNGLGIGILQTIETVDERNFPGYLIDATQTSSNVRGTPGYETRVNPFRGLLTTLATKKRYAVEFKQLLEKNLFGIKSEWLASQLKTFVKRGPTWAAKEGSKDDMVMSCVIMCHLIDELRYHEIELDERLSTNLDENFELEDPNSPMNLPMPPILWD